MQRNIFVAIATGVFVLGGACAVFVWNAPNRPWGGQVSQNIGKILPEPPGVSQFTGTSETINSRKHELPASRASGFRILMDPSRRHWPTMKALLLSREVPPDLNEQQYFGLKSDALNFLRNDESLQSEVEPLLLAIFHDTTLDVVTRDYALQHLAQWYEDGHYSPSIISAIIAGVDERNSSIGGTALLAMSRLVGAESRLDQKAVASAVLKTALDDDAGELSRITAIALAGRIGLKEISGAVLNLTSEVESIPLRVAAIRALAALKDPQYYSHIDQLSRSSVAPVARAAKEALKHFE